MADVNTIAHDQLAGKQAAGDDFMLIDVLSPMSYQRAHLPGATNIDVHEDGFVDRVATEIPDKTTEVVVYCASFDCGASPQAAKKLSEVGYENVYDYEGGLQDWAKQGHDLEGEEAETVREKLAGDE